MNKIGQILLFSNMVVMVLLVIVIALQNKGGGLSMVFGGGGVVQTRVGAEKWLFYSTIVLGILFAGLSIAYLLIGK